MPVISDQDMNAMLAEESRVSRSHRAFGVKCRVAYLITDLCSTFSPSLCRCTLASSTQTAHCTNYIHTPWNTMNSWRWLWRRTNSRRSNAWRISSNKFTISCHSKCFLKVNIYWYILVCQLIIKSWVVQIIDPLIVIVIIMYCKNKHIICLATMGV